MNLIVNGIEAMHGRGGDLHIRARLISQDQLEVSVCDTGVGLPVENPDRIFDAFFTTKTRSTGLGAPPFRGRSLRI
jgi:signal transduction histidine kinase